MNASALPFWMKQRQVKAEPVNDNTLRIVAPQLPVYEIEVRPLGEYWAAAVYQTPTEGAERKLVTESTSPQDNKWHAWEAGFELYRQAVVV
jgi:hypothetical protein